jgi:hypothetical protein
MPRPAQRYDIFLPLRYNDGREIESEKFIQLQDELIEQFNGVTSVKQTNPLQGIWQYQSQRYTDEIIIVTTLDFDYLQSQSEGFFVGLKEELKMRFEQLDILILAQTVTVI